MACKDRSEQSGTARIDASFEKLKADIRFIMVLQTLLILELIFLELYFPS
jgi:hypothetical protein